MNIPYRELTSENLLEAIKIYNQKAYGTDLGRFDAIYIANAVSNMLEFYRESGFGECRLGFPSNIHAKLKIGKSDREGEPEYQLHIHTNDAGDNEESIKENARYKALIEAAWREADFPVL
jgi:hypothetical protein